MFGPATWTKELAKAGFIATAASKLFGTTKPTAAERKAVEDLIGSIEGVDEAEAPAIQRETAGGYHTVTGFRRIEPERFPKPSTDHFTEVTVRDPVRAIFDLRKNLYEIGGVIRGTRILYYRGDESSVSIPPVLMASGGLAPGDVMFHTHPTSLKGYMSGSMPSHADLLVHLRAAAELGDGARHLIAGADGMREIRAEIMDLKKWRKAVTDLYFPILYTFIEELIRGSVWWSTYGIRRALKNLERLDIGGRLVVSEPTTPGSEFIPLKPFIPASHVHPAIIADLERRSAVQLRDLYAKVAEAQGISIFRDRDYYIGVLRELDPSREWDEAAPTKTKALELLRDQGAAITGTRFSKEEIVRHLSGQPVYGKTYLDTSKIDYVKLLGVSPESALPPVPATEEWYVGGMLSDDEIDELFDYVARVHGIPKKRTYEVKVAALEQFDPSGSHFTLPFDEIDKRLRALDVSRKVDAPDPDAMALMPERTRKQIEKRIEIASDLDAWTNEQKRTIIQGQPVHGITFLPDRTVVWWGAMVPGLPEKPPDITPTVSRRSKLPEWTGRDHYRSPLLYSNRQRVFKERWDIALREDVNTAAWLSDELRVVDYALHLLPGTAEAIQSISRYHHRGTSYMPHLQRLTVGDGLNLQTLLYVLTGAAAMKVLRMGYYDDERNFCTPSTRSTFMREWLSVEPWRYEVPKNGILHPTTTLGERAILSAAGQWIQPRGSNGEDPITSFAHAVMAYVTGLPQDPEHHTFIRDSVFRGDVFVQEGPVLAGSDRQAPVRIRKTGGVPLI